MAETAPVDRETFLSRLSASGLLDESEFEQAVAGLPPDGEAKALARHLIQSHGGAIAVEDRPGGGARFRVSLPLAASA